MDEPRPAAEADTGREGLPLEGVPVRVTLSDLYGELLTPLNLTVLVMGALLGLVGLLGGWDRVGEKAQALSTVAANGQMTAEPFVFKFGKAYWYDRVEGLPTNSTGTRGLLVLVDATNTSSVPVGPAVLRAAVRLNASGLQSYGKAVPQEETPPDVYRASDLLRFQALQPGVPTRLALVWFQSGAQPRPQRLSVIGWQQTFRKSSLSGGTAYFDAAPTAQTTLPVTEFRAP